LKLSNAFTTTEISPNLSSDDTDAKKSHILKKNATVVNLSQEVGRNLPSQATRDLDDLDPPIEDSKPRMEEDATTMSSVKSPAHQFHLYGWKPDKSLSDDENYMDIVFLITRSCSPRNDGQQQGHMGSLIVKPSSKVNDNGDMEDDEDHPQHEEERLYRGILGAATNTPLFGAKDCTSDIHAEIAALGQACRGAHSTEGCTAYITIPPCKRCFAALVAFGISRIVTRQVSPQIIRDTACAHDMEVENLTREKNRSQMERINRLVNRDKTDEELMDIAEKSRSQRQQRKLARKEKASG
jgi:deoxycytidylate deaminase